MSGGPLTKFVAKSAGLHQQADGGAGDAQEQQEAGHIDLLADFGGDGRCLLN